MISWQEHGVQVLAITASGKTSFQTVFMFSHKTMDSVSSFVTLSTAAGRTLSVTAGHYLWVTRLSANASSLPITSQFQVIQPLLMGNNHTQLIGKATILHYIYMQQLHCLILCDPKKVSKTCLQTPIFLSHVQLNPWYTSLLAAACSWHCGQRAYHEPPRP